MLKNYFLIILINASRNSLLVLIAWEAIRITNIAGSVGLNLALSNIFFLLASSLSGLIVDKFGSNRVLIFSEFLWCSVLLLFIVLRFFEFCDSFMWLNIFSCILAIFTGMSATATYSLVILTAKNNNDSINIASRNALAISIGFIVGFSVGGLLIDFYGFFIASISSGILSLLSIIFIDNKNNDKNEDDARVKLDFLNYIQGVIYLFRSASLRMVVFGYILSYSVFYVIYALFPGFSKIVLNLSASQFGFIRSTWSIGALLGAVLVPLFSKYIKNKMKLNLFFNVFLGLFLFLFSITFNIYLITILTIAMGFIFALARSILDASIFNIDNKQMVGRVRGNINSLIAIVGLFYYFVSATTIDDYLSFIFYITGILVFVISLLAFFILTLQQKLSVNRLGEVKNHE